MTLNINRFRRAAGQCLLLAGPGVLFTAALMGLFTWATSPYNWPVSFAMTQGAILASTDPVAIVGILKAAGASERLSIQIKGEALFNDAASMILYQMFFKRYRGHLPDTTSFIKFLAKQIFVGPLIGIVAGYACVLMLALSTRRHSEEDSTIQLTATFGIAYLSYFMADLAGGSGVLAVVVAGIIVARAWPLIVAPEALEATWGMFEHIGRRSASPSGVTRHRRDITTQATPLFSHTLAPTRVK